MTKQKYGSHQQSQNKKQITTYEIQTKGGE